METFAQGVVSVLQNPRPEMGEAGRALVAEKYLWSKITDQMEDLYHRVAPAAAVEDS
jgi:glycosyltransferase involved in cell wall biosynthesis